MCTRGGQWFNGNYGGCDNGLEFRNVVVTGLKTLWPGLKTIHGRPRSPQSQGNVERANGDVQNILGSWMREKER